MDPFSALNAIATSTFATTTGYEIADLTHFATSSVLHTFAGFFIEFLQTNGEKVAFLSVLVIALMISVSFISWLRMP